MCKSMDEQFSTCMAWIWSCMCLTLLCTSTQSSTPKWRGGRGINSPRHQSSRSLKVAESSTIGWSDTMLFLGVGSSGATSCCLPPHLTIDTNYLTHWPTHHRSIQCWRDPRNNLTVSYLQTIGWTAADPSVHPVLLLFQPAALCLDFSDHRIDRRCP
jgi:hypothetical protein